MCACLAGKEKAFEELTESYQKVLFNVAFRMVNDYEDARDITQTTLIKAFDKLATYNPKYKFFSWIYRIMINESLNLMSRRRPQEPLEALERIAVHDGDDPAARYGQLRLAEHVQAALMHLSPDYRQAIILRHFMDLSYGEMSALMGIPEKTVKSRLYSARQLLAEILLRPDGAAAAARA